MTSLSVLSDNNVTFSSVNKTENKNTLCVNEAVSSPVMHKETERLFHIGYTINTITVMNPGDFS